MTGGVLSLTDNEIGMLKTKHGVVLFHMDGCGHCVNMMPAWNHVVSELKDSMKNEIILGAVERNNISKFHEHGIKPSVNGFPTVLYFNPSKLNSPEVYNGDRSYEDFKQWIMKKNNKGKSGKGNNNIVSEIKNYEKHIKQRGDKNDSGDRIRIDRFIGKKGDIIFGQEGGGRRYGRSRRSGRSGRSRVKRLRRTRRHRRTHRRTHHHHTKMDVKNGGCGCNSSGSWGF